jgi:protease YdgD
MKKILTAGIVLSLLNCWMPTAQAFHGQPPELQNIFGPDDRVEAPLDREPYRRVVRIMRRNGTKWGRCTGSLIGPSLVLTAQHCIDDILDFNTDHVQAEAQARGATAAFVTRVKEVVARGYWTWRSQPRSEDWVILRTDHDLSAEYGAFEVKEEILGYNDLESEDLLLPGYGRSHFDQGRIMTVGHPCSARNVFRNGLFYHDCDATRGTSGGPVLRCPRENQDRGCYIVGVNVAEFRGRSEDSLTVGHYSDRYANIAVNAWQFIEAVNRALNY